MQYMHWYYVSKDSVFAHTCSTCKYIQTEELFTREKDKLDTWQASLMQLDASIIKLRFSEVLFFYKDWLTRHVSLLFAKKKNACIFMRTYSSDKDWSIYLFIFNSISCVGIGKCEVIFLLCWLLEKCGKTTLQTESSVDKLMCVKGNKTSFCWVVKFCIAVPSVGKKS